MNTNQSIAVAGVLSSVLLIGCDAGQETINGSEGVLNSSGSASIPPGSNSAGSNAMNVRIPRSLQVKEKANNPTSEADGAAEDSPAKAKEVVRDVEVVADSIDSAVAGSPSEALYLGTEMLQSRVTFAQEALEKLDEVWEQLVSYCGSIATGADCEIPAGTLSFEEGMPIDSALVYRNQPSEPFTHTVSRIATDDFSETELIQWSDDRSLIGLSYESSWSDEDGDGTQTSRLQYSAGADGDRISLRDEFTLGQETFTDIQQLHELNDGLNGVEIKTEFNWSDGYASSQWQSQAVANDEGGKLVTTASFTDEASIWHARETFDANGVLVASEHCEQTSGVDCKNPENWNSAVQESDFGWFDIDAAGEDLDAAYALACVAMGLESEGCGFSETDMAILDGASDIFDNTGDVTIYLCVQTGEDELACRAQGAEDSDQSEIVGEQFSSEVNVEPVEVDENYTETHLADLFEGNGVSSGFDIDSTDELDIDSLLASICEDCDENDVFELHRELSEELEIDEYSDESDWIELPGNADEANETLVAAESIENGSMVCDLPSVGACVAEPGIDATELEHGHCEALYEAEGKEEMVICKFNANAADKQ